MRDDSQYGYASETGELDRLDDRQERRPSGNAVVARAGVWFFALASLMFLGLAGVVTWRWLDRNVLHWGVEAGRTETVNHAELVQRVRAFELATVKHTYQGEAHIDAGKVLAAGPVRRSLPSWVAGQQLDVTGKVTVTAGVDLSGVRPEDMEIVRQGKDVRVVIRVPAPRVLSSELEPDTLDMDTRSGVITRLGRGVGLGEKDLRDRAADEVIAGARESAVRGGILQDAGRETERRLQAFLQSMPQTGERVTYVVEVREPSVQ